MNSTKRLEDMSLEELWRLFPIELVAHRGEWAQWAREEIRSLNSTLSSCSPVIHHIGSTAIPTISAKPIIDILVETPPTSDWNIIRNKMENAGYICMSSSDQSMSFNKGYTPYGYADRVFHIHFHLSGDNDELYFRDYLLAHPSVASEYEALKLALLPQYKYDRDGYTAAKTDFIRRITRLAIACKEKRSAYLPE